MLKLTVHFSNLTIFCVALSASNGTQVSSVVFSSFYKSDKELWAAWTSSKQQTDHSMLVCVYPNATFHSPHCLI